MTPSQEVQLRSDSGKPVTDVNPIVAAVAIVGLSGIGVTAICKGIDGVILGSIITIIGGIAGFGLHALLLRKNA